MTVYLLGVKLRQTCATEDSLFHDSFPFPIGTTWRTSLDLEIDSFPLPMSTLSQHELVIISCAPPAHFDTTGVILDMHVMSRPTYQHRPQQPLDRPQLPLE